MNKQTTLRDLYLEHKKGKVSSKWESYFTIYERHLEGLRLKRLNMVEIGVQNGGSLDLWSQYFPFAQICGIDVDHRVSKLVYETNRISVLVGAASSKEVISKVQANFPNGLDIVIDDGSHRSKDTVYNFVNYFHLLKPGGLFIVEDMHAGYWHEFGGGINEPLSCIGFFKNLIDLINIEHSRDTFNLDDLFGKYFPQGVKPVCLKTQSIAAITAYNSVFIIEKASDRLEPKLGSVVIVGREAIVNDKVSPEVVRAP